MLSSAELYHVFINVDANNNKLITTGVKQARRESGVGGLAIPGPATFGGPTVGQNYAQMYNLKKKNSKIFFPEGPCENVSPGPAVALDGPAQCMQL